jgi:Fe-Mn family superoxide dismutase
MFETNRYYELPKLSYDYKDLAPYMSEEQLRIHHTKHHRAYVDGANAIVQKLEMARTEGIHLDMRATLKDLSFNIGGRLLHSLFWNNLMPNGEDGKRPNSMLDAVLEKEFGTIDRFKEEFSQAAASVEGSGWAALAFCMSTQRPIIMQIEKHNNNIFPMYGILMLLDMFEHAYYIDYKNDRAKYIQAFWHIVDWDAVGKRLQTVMK